MTTPIYYDTAGLMVVCPACGSADVATSHENATLPVEWSEPAAYIETVHSCQSCGIEGDFTGENDHKIQHALEQTRGGAARRIMASLEKDGFAGPLLWRVLGLPRSTLDQWRAGECSPEALALLRLVRAHPWILVE